MPTGMSSKVNRAAITVALFVLERILSRPCRGRGYITRVEKSKSAGFWCIIRAEDGRILFAYGKHFLNWPDPVRAGWPVEFTVLPPNDGRMARATEIAIRRRRQKTSSQ
jgi:hypothetical protein